MTGRREARQLLAHTVEPGDHRLHNLLQDHDPETIWSMVEDRGLSIPESWLLRAPMAPALLQQSLETAEREQIRWLDPEDAAWPVGLDVFNKHGYLDEPGSPIGLWIRGAGDPEELFNGKSLAIVGARSCTTYGAQAANDLAADSASAGYTVVSGGAFGIDGAAHRGALAAGGPTIAVLPGGVDVDYPRAHAALFSRIAEDGLLVSEYAPGQTPTRTRFLSRNRLIAGIANATVVVEAGPRSGALNTLHWANGLGRPTFAVPGPTTSTLSAGTHQAIRSGRAALATSASDVVNDLGRTQSISTRVAATHPSIGM